MVGVGHQTMHKWRQLSRNPCITSSVTHLLERLAPVLRLPITMVWAPNSLTMVFWRPPGIPTLLEPFSSSSSLASAMVVLLMPSAAQTSAVANYGWPSASAAGTGRSYAAQGGRRSVR